MNTKQIPLLDVRGLSKSYNGVRVVDNLSFSVYPGEVVSLLGSNGAGKTTTFYMTIGLIKPDGGTVFLNGVDVTREPLHKRARLGMGYLAQEPSVFRALTVEENIVAILETLEISRDEQEWRLEELLLELDLQRHRKKKASLLSGGERRRLEITRALVTRPALLLLDEPFASIDPIAVHDLQQLIKHLKSKGISVLITDHNAREIFSIADRNYLIQQGRVLLSGTALELTENQQARAAYFGETFKL